MDTKEKTKELFDKFRKHSHAGWHPEIGFDNEEGDINAKECALIAVDEILQEVGKWKNTYMGKDQHKYWQEVKNELNKL